MTEQFDPTIFQWALEANQLTCADIDRIMSLPAGLAACWEVGMIQPSRAETIQLQWILSARLMFNTSLDQVV